MVEDKIKDEQPQQQAAAQRTPKWRERWRSFKARVECMQVLQRHKRRKHTHRMLEATAQKALSLPPVHMVGEGLYTIGFSAEYTAICAGRATCAVYRVTQRALHEVWQRLLQTAFPGAAQVLREILAPFYVLAYAVRGVYDLQQYGSKIRREKGRAAALHAQLVYIGGGIKRSLRLLSKTVAYIVPLCAAFGAWMVFRTAMGTSFALAVQVNGETVGYVASESVFDAAKETVSERISYVSTDTTRWSIEPSYTLSYAVDEVMDTNEMVDTILRVSGDEITEGTALYLDDELVAVTTDGLKLRSYISSLISPYEDPEDANLSVCFNHEVEFVDGLFLAEGFTEYDDILNYLSGVKQEQQNYIVQSGDSISLIASKNGLTVSELCELNADIGLENSSTLLPGDSLVVTREEAVLEVRITRMTTWQEEIPYTTEKSTSDSYNVGTTKTVQEGENGIRSVTAQDVYDTDGNLLERTIVRTEVVKEPVTEKIVTGTKVVTNKNSSTTSLGGLSLMWPVPSYTYCSRWYYTGHKGVDICAPAGTPIYAAASGTVTKAGYEKGGLGTGYGYGILISHGNGYSTAYAHCLRIVVSVGQTVKQGQLIGYVGSTGRSSGNHCHFEIRYNNSYLAPQNYFKNKK